MAEGEDVSDPDELEVIGNTKHRTVRCQGEQIEVVPLVIGQLPAFSRALRPAMEPINALIEAGDISLESAFDLIEKHGDDLIDAVAIAIWKERDWVAASPLEDFTELVTAVLATNLDFFVQRLLPRLHRELLDLVGQLAKTVGSGRTPSNS